MRIIALKGHIALPGVVETLGGGLNLTLAVPFSGCESQPVVDAVTLEYGAEG